MAKQSRFPCRLDTWVTEQMDDVCTAVAQEHAVAKGVVVRQALQFYFSKIGALPQRNGQYVRDEAHV